MELLPENLLPGRGENLTLGDCEPKSLTRCGLRVVHRVSSSLLGLIVRSSRALSGRLKFTVRLHKSNQDFSFFCCGLRGSGSGWTIRGFGLRGQGLGFRVDRPCAGFRHGGAAIDGQALRRVREVNQPAPGLRV